MRRLRQIRKQQKLSLKALAEKTGIAHKLLSKYELGTVDPPSSKVLRIAVALGVPVGILYDQNGTVTANTEEPPHA